ncbi:CMRF35-like molecule 7 [Oncorhynchus clarkii lewisi]|uniref:CMRF35-like molecule 7 n=1 Tax=Oncorhynchus clarkii lewisi TaxID=490388 RepID=UPI0039B82C35
MKILHVVSCCLLSALCVVVSAGTKEVVGGHVVFSCSFFWAGTNNKYFCKGTCSGRDILVETKRSKTVSQGRYSIEDKGDGVFYVTIKNLMKSDSGTYWCGVERYGLDTYQEVNLAVTDASPETSTLTSRPHVSTTLPNLSKTSSNLSTTLPNLSTTFMASGDISVGPSQRTVTPVVIMVCVSLTVLVVGLILLLIYKWRRDRTSSTTQDSTYQTLNTTTQDSTNQTLNRATQDSTYQILNTTTQDSTYQTLNTTPPDKTLNITTQDST